MPRKIHVIVNPASGKPQPVLSTLNHAFREAGVEWELSITKESGDAHRFAKAAVEAGVDAVGAYGGDGTVMEVAHALRGSEVPLAILPGGTANLMSVELGIPKDLGQAAALAADEKSVVRQVDMGKAGERYFILRVGTGFAGEQIKHASREMKDRWGIMAYSIAKLKALQTVESAHYRIVVDGVEHVMEGLNCLVDNAGNLGMPGISASKKISVSDGLLDVLFMKDASISTFVAIGSSITDRGPRPDSLMHWQARHITIETDPPHPVQGDGELWGETPVTIEVVPNAVGVLVSQVS